MNRVREREHLRHQRIANLECAILVGLEHISTGAVRIEDHRVGCEVLTAHPVSWTCRMTSPSQRILLANGPVLCGHQYIRHNLQFEVEHRVAIVPRSVLQRVKDGLRHIGVRPVVRQVWLTVQTILACA